MSDVMVAVAVLFMFVFLCMEIAAHVFSREARMRRALRAAQRVEIAKAPDHGTVKIAGRVRLSGPPLLAPLTGRPCTYFEVTVEEWRSSGGSGWYRTILHLKEGHDFFVEDGSGRALVKLPTPDVLVTNDAHFKSGTFNEATPQLEAFLARHGARSKGWLFNKNMRYREGVLEEGEPVAACGIASREPDPDPGRTPTRLVLAGNALVPLMVSDDPRVVD